MGVHVSRDARKADASRRPLANRDPNPKLDWSKSAFGISSENQLQKSFGSRESVLAFSAYDRGISCCAVFPIRRHILDKTAKKTNMDPNFLT